mgnify:CR=1 FL=1
MKIKVAGRETSDPHGEFYPSMPAIGRNEIASQDLQDGLPNHANELQRRFGFKSEDQETHGRVLSDFKSTKYYYIKEEKSSGS